MTRLLGEFVIIDTDDLRGINGSHCGIGRSYMDDRS